MTEKTAVGETAGEEGGQGHQFKQAKHNKQVRIQLRAERGLDRQ